MNDSAGKNPSPDQARPKRRWTRRLAILLILGIGLLVVVLAAAPSLLSTGGGRAMIAGQINQRIAGRVRIESLDLNWFSGQTINGLRLDDPAGEQVMQVEQVAVEATLWSLVTGSRALGEVRLTEPTGHIIADESGRTNLQRALATTEGTSSSSNDDQNNPGDDHALFTLPATAKIIVTDARLRMTQPDVPTVAFEGLAEVDATARSGPVKIKVDGQTRQEQLSGDVKVDLTVRGFDSTGRLTREAVRIEGTARLSDLPVAGLDTLIAADGLLNAALGQTLNVDLDLQSSSTGGLTGRLVMGSEQLDGQVNLAIDDNRQLTADGTIRFTATTALADKLTANTGAAVSLQRSVPLEVRLNKLAMPLGTFDPRAVALTINAQLGDGTMRLDDSGQTVGWSNARFAVQTDSLSQAVAITGQARTTAAGGQGDLALDITAARLFDSSGRAQLDQAGLSATVTAERLPVALMDRLAGQEGRLVEAVGSWADLAVQTRRTGPDAFDLTMTAESPQLQRSELAFAVDQRITLSKPATIRYAMPVKLIAAKGDRSTGLRLSASDEQVPVTVELTELSLARPAAGERFFQPDRSSLAAELTIGPVNANRLYQDESLRVDAVNVKVDGPSIAQLTVDAEARLSPIGSTGQLAGLIGKQGVVRLTGDVGLADTGQLREAELRLTLDIEAMQGDLAGRLDPQMRLALREPATMKLTVNPALAAGWIGDAQDAPRLTEPVTVSMRLTRLAAPLAPFDATAIAMEGSGEITGLTLGGLDQVQQVALDDGRFEARLNGPDNRLQATMTGRTAVQRAGQIHQGRLEAKVDLTSWHRQGAVDLAGANGSVNIGLTDVPTALVDALAGQGGQLVAMAGPTLQLTARSDLAAAGRRGISLDLQAERLTASGEMAIEQPISMVQPIQFRWQLTPQAFVAMTGQNQSGTSEEALVLTEPVTISGKVTRLQWPRAGGEKTGQPYFASIDRTEIAIAAELAADSMTLRDGRTGGRAQLRNLQVKLDAPDGTRPVKLSARGNMHYTQADGSQAGQGKLALDVTIADLFGELARGRGAMTPDMQISAELAQVPVAWIDALAGAERRLVAMLGPASNLTMQADLQDNRGPIDLAVTSELAEAKVKARLDEGVIHFTEDLTAQVKVTPELGEKVLGEANFLLKTAYSAEQPIRLRVPKDNVAIAVRDAQTGRWALDLGSTRIPRIELDLGRIALENDFVLQMIMRFAKRQTPKRMEAHFTPLIASFADGTLRYEKRNDVLIDSSMHLVTFGSVDLVNRTFNMALGLPAGTLDRLFDLEDLPADTVFQIPVNGPISKPNVDLGAAATQMGALQAKMRLSGDNPLLGALAGGALEELLGGGRKRLTVPAPSVNPLPWAQPTQPQDSTDPAEGSPDTDTGAQQSRSTADQPDAADTSQADSSNEEDVGRRVLEGLLREVLK